MLMFIFLGNFWKSICIQRLTENTILLDSR